jgi:hypothetical protein
MPESPLLARHAVIAAGTAIGFGETDGYEASRALLAAHDPDELARQYDQHLLAKGQLMSDASRQNVREALRWIIRGDDA